MKRRIIILLSVLVLCLTFPLSAYAKAYSVSETDISISVDDASWYVFTRDNLQNNSELEELGISGDYLRDFFADNMVYMNALLLYEDGDYLELLVRKNVTDGGIANLSNYSDTDVMEIAKEIASAKDIENSSVYKNQYKFIELDFFDTSCNFYVHQFMTIVNRDFYAITFQSPTSITKEEQEEIKHIVDSISFDIDTSIKEPQTSYFSDAIKEKFITGAISGGIVAIFALLIRKIKQAGKAKKKGNASDGVPESTKASKTELDTKVTLEKHEYKQKTNGEDKVSNVPQSTAQKDIDADKCFDAIKKYKELLELGIITQEEFDAKKKELLKL